MLLNLEKVKKTCSRKGSTNKLVKEIVKKSDYKHIVDKLFPMLYMLKHIF